MSKPSFDTLWGSVPALATPVADDGGVDTEGLARLVEHVVSGGVGGTFSVRVRSSTRGPGMPSGDASSARLEPAVRATSRNSQG